MKKRLIAIILSVVMIFSVTTIPASAIDFESTDSVVTNVLGKVIEWVFSTLIEGLAGVMDGGDNFVNEEDYTYENFYEGTGDFLDSAAVGAKWSLGSAERSLVPENWESYDIYLGGYINGDNMFTNDVRVAL